MSFRYFCKFKIFFLTLSFCLFGAEGERKEDAPWFTGTLLSPISEVVGKDKVVFQYYLFVTDVLGFYDGNWEPRSLPDFYTVSPQFLLYVGLSERIDLFVFLAANYNRVGDLSSFEWADIPVGLDFQLVALNEIKGIPAIKFAVAEIFPTGKFQGLNPLLLQSNTGRGACGTDLQIVLYDVFKFPKKRFLSLKWSLDFTFFTRGHVHGASPFGGGEGTDGFIYLGNIWSTIFAWEYTLTKNWVLACDTVYTHVDETTFIGHAGAIPLGKPSSEQISLAPAIEYNFSEKFGVLGGVWFTLAGRNADRFVSTVLSAVYTF